MINPIYLRYLSAGKWHGKWIIPLLPLSEIRTPQKSHLTSPVALHSDQLSRFLQKSSAASKTVPSPLKLYPQIWTVKYPWLQLWGSYWFSPLHSSDDQDSGSCIFTAWAVFFFSISFLKSVSNNSMGHWFWILSGIF